MSKCVFGILIALTCICCIASAQNLFPNPDFEEYNDCPLTYSGININECTDWSCISGSPDYYNCSFYGSAAGGIYGVPSSGEGVVGMWGLINNVYCEGELQRESIFARLTEPLQSCKIYEVSFELRLDKIGVASTSGKGHDCLDFGFYFYKDNNPNTCRNPCNCWDVEPQVAVSSSQIPFDGYATFSFKFLAEDNFNRVAIGPFCNDKMNLPECFAPPQNRGPFELYYNLDNIVLELSKEDSQVLVSDNEICQNDSIILYENRLDSVFAWEWKINGAIQNSPSDQFTSFIFPTPGVYSVELISLGFCGMDTAVFSDLIVVHPSYTEKYLDSSVTLCSDNVYTVSSANPNLDYFWSDSIMGSTRSFNDSGNYILYIRDDFGCRDDSLSIQVELMRDLLIFPNPSMRFWRSKNSLATPNRIELVDILGRVIYTEENVIDLEIDAWKLSLSKGTYFLLVHSQNCKSIEKLVLVRNK